MFGKLGFMSLAGWLTDALGYPAMFVAFAVLSAAILPWFDCCPEDLKLLSERLKEQQARLNEKEIQEGGRGKVD